MQIQMQESWRIQQTHMGSSERESEELKRMMLESNPYLLAITMVVSVLHMIFDGLAFKNDITFWKNKKRFDTHHSLIRSLSTLFVPWELDS
jgi:hypothetical protein